MVASQLHRHQTAAIEQYVGTVQLLIKAPGVYQNTGFRTPASIRDRRLFETLRL